MSAPSIPFVSPGIVAPSTADAGLTRLRAVAAVALLAALGILMATSILASGDEPSAARAREHAPPAARAGPIDRHC